MTPFWIFCATSKSAGPSSARRHDHKKFFCEWAAWTSDDSQACTKHFQSMSAPKHFQLNPLSVWKITICMEQSISQSPHFLCPIKEEGSVQWGFDSPGCQMDLDGKPWQLCVIGVCCLPIMMKVVWSERERLITGVFQVTYITVGSQWLMPPHTDTLKQTLHTVHLSLNHISSY